MRAADINAGVERCFATPGALLLDVRQPEEYALARIPGSVNLPLSNLEEVQELAPDPDTPLFVYCLSGARSSRAAAWLLEQGYEQVTDLGAMNRYNGTLERNE